MVLMVVTVLVFVKKSFFQSKTQKRQNTKQTLVPEGRISQNISQLDQFAVCTVSMFREDTPLQFWAKNALLSHPYDPVALNLMLLLFLAPSWADPSWKQAAALVMNQIKTLARSHDVFERAFGLDLKKTVNKRHDLPQTSALIRCISTPSSSFLN